MTPKLLAFGIFVVCLNCQTSTAQESAKQREFQFEYGATIKELPQDAKVRVWIPVATSHTYQSVRMTSQSLPAEGKIHFDKKYNNRILYFEKTHAGTGNLSFKLTYDVKRSEAQATGKLSGLDQSDLEIFLQPNKMVPITGRPLDLFAEFEKQRKSDEDQSNDDPGRKIYDFVGQHLAYDKSKPGYGNGDVNWACDSKTGNCTDFHSLFISVARAQQFPAKFQIGFPLPEKRGSGNIAGYHCWAQFYTKENGWFPVDISEADKDPSKKDYFFGKLNENRIYFSTGRDVDLEPKQDSEPLNYFIYPHIEVNGKVYPKKKLHLEFRFEDKSLTAQ